MLRRGAARQVGLALLVSLLAPWCFTAAAGADDAPPGFVRGEATASADTIALRAQLGNVTVGYTLGRSIAHYQELAGNAEGRALDLEALPTLIGETAACPGVTPQLPASALPPVTSVESGQPGAEGSHRTQSFFPELQHGLSTLSAGYQDASATAKPTSSGHTETPNEDLGLLSIWNGRSTSSTQLNGHTREAIASTEADTVSFLGNTLVLRHPKWTATAHSGDQTDVGGSFTVDGGTFFGLQRSASQIKADLSWLSGTVASLLASVGAHLDLPKVVVDGRTVKVTPLTFRLTNMPLGRYVVGPLLNLFTAQIQTYYDQLRASGCSGESTAQLTALAQGVLTGSGTVAIPIGGVSATTDDTYYPPLDLSPAPSPTAESTAPPPETPTAPVEPSSAPLADASIPAAPVADLSAAVPIAPVPIAPIVSSTPAPASGSREVASGAGPRVHAKDGATGGAAALVGALGIAAAIGLALADRVSIIRGRRRVIPS